MSKKANIFLDVVKRSFIFLLISSLIYGYITNDIFKRILEDIFSGNYNFESFQKLVVDSAYNNYRYFILITCLDIFVYIILIYTLFKKSVSILNVEINRKGECTFENGIVKSIIVIACIKIAEQFLYLFIPSKLVFILVIVSITYVIIRTYIKIDKTYKQLILFYKWFFAKKFLKYLVYIISLFIMLFVIISLFIFSAIYLKELGYVVDFKIVLSIILVINYLMYNLFILYIKYLYMWYLSEYVNEYLGYIIYKSQNIKGENN